MLATINQKRTFYTLCSGYLFQCFTLFGLFSVLVLFFVGKMQLPDRAAYLFFGNYAALNYLAEFAGGFLGGRYLSFRLASVLGLVIMLFGSLVMVFHQQMHAMNLGLTLFACGSGLFAPNLRNLVGDYFLTVSTAQRDSGFTILHVFNIVGQFFGPIVLGALLATHVHWMFGATSIALGMALLLLSLNYRSLNFINDNNRPSKNSAKWVGLLCTLAMLIATFFILEYRDVEYVLQLILVLTLVGFIIALLRTSLVERRRIFSVLIIFAAMLIVEICFRQELGSAKLYIDYYVDRAVWGFTMKTAYYQSLEPVFLIVFAFPLNWLRLRLEKRGGYFSLGTSMAIGLGFLASSYVFLLLGNQLAATAGKVSSLWLVLHYAILAIAELFTIPTVLSAVTSLSPQAWRGMMMGLLSLTASVASYSSGWIGEYTSPTKTTGTAALGAYTQLFSALMGLAAGTAIIIYFVWRYWEKKFGTPDAQSRTRSL